MTADARVAELWQKNRGGHVPAEAALTYTYAWGNNPRRRELKGRRCELIASGRMGTVLVRFLDTGERITTSRRALRKLP